jgi:MFS family permease
LAGYFTSRLPGLANDGTGAANASNAVLAAHPTDASRAPGAASTPAPCADTSFAVRLGPRSLDADDLRLDADDLRLDVGAPRTARTRHPHPVLDVPNVSRAKSLAADSRLQAVLSMVAVGVLAGTIVSPTFPGMVAAFELTEARVALVMTAFFLPAAVAIPIVGSIADAWGRRPIVLGSLLVYGVAGVGVALADSFAAVLALRVVQGCAFPGLLPLSVAVIGDLYDGADATLAQGFRSSVNGFAGVVAPAIAGVAAGVSWRLPYWLYVLALPALLLCYVSLPESGRPAERTARPELRRAFDRSKVGGTVREVAGALTRPLLAVIGATFAVFLVRYALVTFVPLYVVRAFDASDAVGGFAVAIVGLGRFVVSPTAGRLVDRLGRRTVLLGGLGTIAAGTWLLLLAPGPAALLLAIGLLSAGEGAFNPVANDFVTAGTPTAVRGRVVSVLEVGKTAAVAASPVVFGAVLAASSFRVLFLVGGLLVAAAAVVVASDYARVSDPRNDESAVDGEAAIED